MTRHELLDRYFFVLRILLWILQNARWKDHVTTGQVNTKHEAVREELHRH